MDPQQAIVQVGVETLGAVERPEESVYIPVAICQELVEVPRGGDVNAPDMPRLLILRYKLEDIVLLLVIMPTRRHAPPSQRK